MQAQERKEQREFELKKLEMQAQERKDRLQFELRQQELFGNSVSFANTAMRTPATPEPSTPNRNLFETPTTTRRERGKTHLDSITKVVQQLRDVLDEQTVSATS